MRLAFWLARSLIAARRLFATWRRLFSSLLACEPGARFTGSVYPGKERWLARLMGRLELTR